jgi:hypothetical protein
MSAVHDVLRRLPELPQETFEAAGTLQRSDRGPFVTLRPHKPAAPQEPPVPANAPSKSSFTVRRYFTQALYPRVICYDPGDLVVGLEMRFDPQPFPGRDQPPTDVATLAREERFYKLSALASGPLRNPLWCSVKYGPWLAVANETESCLVGVPNQWEFFIVEVPEVALVWFGEWADMPAFPSLTVIMGDLVLAGHETVCCPGFQWCPTTQSCIPLQVDCQDPFPA